MMYKHSKKVLGFQQLESEWVAMYAPQPPLLQTRFMMIVFRQVLVGLSMAQVR